MIETPVAIWGRVRQHRFCGHSMAQSDTNGTIMFIHTTGLKTLSIARLGNTFESIQYLQKTAIIPQNQMKDGLYAVSANYPVTEEYGGGVVRLPEEGGVGKEVFVNNCLEYVARNSTIVKYALMIVYFQRSY